MNYSTIGKALLLLPLLLLFSCNDQSKQIKELEKCLAESDKYLNRLIEFHPFRLIKGHISASARADDARITDLMDQFYIQKARSPMKVQPYLEDAERVKLAVEQFDSLVVDMHDRLLDTTKDHGIYLTIERHRIPTKMLVEGREGYKLKEKIDAFRETMFSLASFRRALSDEEYKVLSMQMPLHTEYGKEIAREQGLNDWVEFHFKEVPVLPTLTILSQIRSDAKASAAIVLETLYRQIDRRSYQFEALGAQTLSPSTYVIEGDDFHADVFLKAINAWDQPQVLIGEFRDDADVYYDTGELKHRVTENPLKDDYTLLRVGNSIGRYKITTKGLGLKKVTGVAKVRKPNSDEFEYYPFETSYVVGEKPMMFISQDHKQKIINNIEQAKRLVSDFDKGIDVIKSKLIKEIQAGSAGDTKDKSRDVATKMKLKSLQKDLMQLEKDLLGLSSFSAFDRKTIKSMLPVQLPNSYEELSIIEALNILDEFDDRAMKMEGLFLGYLANERSIPVDK